ncbi:MAG: hypothetical protein ABIP94_00510 [Planctomycetota bacterium]
MTQERTLAADTSLVAERTQFDVWRRMTATEKFTAFLDLQQTSTALADAGIRLRYPRADAREVFLRRVARSLDRATMRRVYGWDPDSPA